MKKKIIMFAINAVFIGLITVIWASLVLAYILPTAENATHDTVISQPDTLSFDAEMAMIDSIMGSQPSFYEDEYMIQNLEIRDVAADRNEQTLIRYPNGIPKITVIWDKSDKCRGCQIRIKNMLNFYSENGQNIATGYTLGSDDTTFAWFCNRYNSKDGKAFMFSNPNVCRNIMQH